VLLFAWAFVEQSVFDVFAAADVPAEAGFKTVPGVSTTYKIQTEGEGKDVVDVGDLVEVHATGSVRATGTKFWSTKDAGQKAFTYNAGVAQVITGWDQGCLGMSVGEVRKLDIPADEGYGAKGFPAWGIPANGGLQFEIEVLSIEGKK